MSRLTSLTVYLVLVLFCVCIPAEEGKCECKFNEKLNRHELLCVNKTLTSFPNLEDYKCGYDKIDLSINSLKHVGNESFSQTPHLKIVIMHRDAIRTIDLNTYYVLQDLEEIDLSDNILDYIHPDMFVKNTKLEKVVLSNNPLFRTSVSTSILNAPSVKSLDLYGCKLGTINKDMFSNLRNLQFLDLSANDLKSIPTNTFTGMYSLTSVKINFNEWSCDCLFQNLRDFVANLRAKSLTTDMSKHMRPVRCFLDNGKGMKTVTEATKLLDCEEHTKYCSSKECEIVLPLSQTTVILPPTPTTIVSKDTSVKMDCIDDDVGCTPEDCLTVEYGAPYVILIAGGFIIVTIAVLFFIGKCCLRGFCCASPSYVTVSKSDSTQYDTNICTVDERNRKEMIYSSKHRLMSTGSFTDDFNQTSPILAVYNDQLAEVFTFPGRVHVYEQIQNTNNLDHTWTVVP